MTVEYRDLMKAEYDGITINYDVAYDVDNFETNTYTFTCIDTSVIPNPANTYTKEWKVTIPRQAPVTGTGSVFSITIANLDTAIFEFSLTNTKTRSITRLQRYFYSTTMATIDGLLNRTSTAISKEHPSTPGYVYDNANNYKILSLESEEYNRTYNALMGLMNSGYVKYATGISLDYLAAFWMIKRNNGENDDTLRSRLENAIQVNNSAVTKINIKRLMLGAFGLLPESEQDIITTRDVIIMEREEVPSYDLSVRGAEFTVYILGNPTITTNLQSIDDIINKSRAAGVYYNPFQFTFVTELYADVNCDEFLIMDFLETQTIFGWGDMQWGSPNEPGPINSSSVTAAYTFPVAGAYNVSAIVTDTSDATSAIQRSFTVR